MNYFVWKSVHSNRCGLCEADSLQIAGVDFSPYLHLGVRSQLQQRSGNSQAHELTRVSQNIDNNSIDGCVNRALVQLSACLFQLWFGRIPSGFSLPYILLTRSRQKQLELRLSFSKLS
jgi:hypothetical protein